MLRAISAGKSQPGSGLGEFYRSIHYRDSTFANRPRLKRKTECARAGRRSRGGFGQREMALKGVRAGNSSPMVRNPPLQIALQSVPMIILYISRSEPGVKPYPTPAFTSKSV